MALPFQTAGDKDGVGAFLECLHQEQGIDLAGTGQADDPDIGRILQPHRTGQVGGGKRTKVTAKGHYFRFKITHLFASFSSLSNSAAVLAIT